MASTWNAPLQETLSENGSFVLCDTRVDGFPIRYASPGFAQLFECNAEACLDKRYDALMKDPSAVGCATDLLSAASALGLMPALLDEAITFLTTYVADTFQAMMTNPEHQIGFTLTLNRKKSGALFVCENIMLVLKHPIVKWPYAVILQCDIVNEVSVEQLLDAVRVGSYRELTKNQEESMKNRVSIWGTDGERTAEHFHAKAAEMWRRMMTQSLVKPIALNPNLPQVSFSAAGSDMGGLRKVSTDFKPDLLKTTSEPGDICHVWTGMPLNLEFDVNDDAEPMAPKRAKSKQTWS